MQITFALNITLGTILIIVLILANYLSTYNTDTFQRKIVVTLLILVAVPLIMEFIFYSIQGTPGKSVNFFIKLSKIVYYTAQFPSFYFCYTFINYSTLKHPERTKKTIKITLIISAINFILLLFNLKWNFFYSVTDENTFLLGDYYFIRYILNCPAFLLAFIDVIRFHKSSGGPSLHLYLIIIFFCMAGLIIDIYLSSKTTFYVFYSAAMLYAYFFIIKVNSNIDQLTGLDNRLSFNEFIRHLKQTRDHDPYAIVMIDIDHFKNINDTLGHLEGDNALKDMASIIKNCIRSCDFSARYGGDEFIIAAKNSRDAELLVQCLTDSINVHNEKSARPYKIEMSYGYDIYTAESNFSIEEFLNHIDLLMYKNKNERRRASDKERGR